jgi:tripartite-type tricarboxylate transporter receptor subunit TctC
MKPATLFGVLASAVFAASAAAQNYPSRPVRIVVPFVPAGPTDNQARWAAQQLTTATGLQFFVDNRPGAGGVPGSTTEIDRRDLLALVPQLARYRQPRLPVHHLVLLRAPARVFHQHQLPDDQQPLSPRVRPGMVR